MCIIPSEPLAHLPLSQGEEPVPAKKSSPPLDKGGGVKEKVRGTFFTKFDPPDQIFYARTLAGTPSSYAAQAGGGAHAPGWFQF